MLSKELRSCIEAGLVVDTNCVPKTLFYFKCKSVICFFLLCAMISWYPILATFECTHYNVKGILGKYLFDKFHTYVQRLFRFYHILDILWRMTGQLLISIFPTTQYSIVYIVRSRENKYFPKNNIFTLSRFQKLQQQ